MAARKKRPYARKSTKKAKASRRVAKPSIKVRGALPKLELNMPLDDKKIAQIKRCLTKGKLKITVSKLDLVGGKLGDPWLYD